MCICLIFDFELDKYQCVYLNWKKQIHWVSWKAPRTDPREHSFIMGYIRITLAVAFTCEKHWLVGSYASNATRAVVHVAIWA